MTSVLAFKSFNTVQGTVLALTIAVPAALLFFNRAVGDPRFSRRVGFAIGLMLLVNEIAAIFFKIQLGSAGIDNMLPLHVCDWAIYSMIAASVWRRPFAYEMAYFWGMAATTHALLTPDISYQWPDPRLICFYIAHSGIVIGAVFLTFGMGMRPRPGAFYRMMIALQIYVLLILFVNWGLDVNYGFLCEKPHNPTLIDNLGPWPWYILSMDAIAAFSFWLYGVPFQIAGAFLKSEDARPAQT